MTLGGNLQRLRKERGLSQEEVAQALFLTRQSVSKWENDGAEPGVENLKALAKLYGVTLDELMGNVPETGDAATEETDQFQPKDWFHLGVMVRFLTAMYGIFVIDPELLAYDWDLPLLFAGFRFRNRYVWGAILGLETASLFVHLIVTAKAFWFWTDYDLWLPFQFLFVTAGIALALAVFLQKKTRKYFME